MELMFLQRLSLAGDADERTIRRAYARELKLIDQEHDAAGFQSLREAYEAALFWVRNPEYFAGDDDGDGEEKRAQVQANAPPAPDAAGTEVIEATALSAEVLPADEDPQALGDEVFEEFVARLPALAAAAKGPIESETPWAQALQTCLDDLRLFGIDAREQFERRVAMLLAEGWRPGHEALLVAAVDTFGWAADRRRVQNLGYAGMLIDLAIDERALFDSQHDDEADAQRRLLQQLRDPAMPSWRVLALQVHALETMTARFPNWLSMVVDVDTINSWRKMEENMPGWQRALALLGLKRRATMRDARAEDTFRWYWVWVLLVVIFFAVRTLSNTGADHHNVPPVMALDAEALINQAENQYFDGQMEAAMTSLDQANALKPDFADAYAMRAYLWQLAGVEKPIDSMLEKAAALNPDSVRLLRLRAAISANRGNFQEALRDIDRLLPGDEDLYFTRILQVEVLLNVQRSPEALEQLESMLTHFSDKPRVYHLIAFIHKKNGNMEKAMEVLTRGVASAPDATMYLDRALLRPASDRAGRERDFDSALALTDNPFKVQRVRGQWERDTGRPEDAIATYKKAMERTENADILIELLALRGVAYTMAGKPDQAAKDFEKAYTRADTALRLNNLAWCMVTHNTALPTALAFSQKSNADQPEDAAHLDTEGVILLRLGKFDQAVERFDRALALAPTMAGTLFVRGIARQHLGQQAGAAADLKAARAKRPGIDAEYAGYGIKP